LQTEPDRLVAAIRAGMDPNVAANVAAPETRAIQAAITEATAEITAWEQSREPEALGLTDGEVRTALSKVDAVVDLLQRADREDRGALYRALGITLRYERTTAGGGTSPRPAVSVDQRVAVVS
jgi:hypothetical protein